MPRGRYSHHDVHDLTPLGEEHFHCATGPSGWRYTARTTDASGRFTGSVDLTLDHLGRPVRLGLHSGDWQVRGAALDGVTWVRTDRTGEYGQEGNAPAHSFTGTSPAFLVATARLLHPVLGGSATRVRLVALTHPVLAPRTVDQSWVLVDRTTHPADNGVLAVEQYQVTTLDTGEESAVYLAGDIVLAAPGVELEDLDTPPSTFR
jgi:hypothetical protein